MAIAKGLLRRLAKFLEGERPNDVGEWGMHCPFHDDQTRSASLNVESGLWYCNACDIGGSVRDLVKRIENGEQTIASFELEDKSDNAPKVSETQVREWHSALLDSGAPFKTLQTRRGISPETISRFQIGWDPRDRVYTIPIRDHSGAVCNIRFYQMDAPADRRKIWSVAGHGEPVLYPLSILEDSQEIIICEGEWDALLTIQKGFAAITRTGAAKVWKSSWNRYFEDKIIYLCHDMDEAGQRGNAIVLDALKDYAAEVKTVMLPYKVTAKHGKDLTDYWQAGFEPADFKELLSDSEGVVRDPSLVEKEYITVPVLDSFDAGVAGEKLRMRVTIIGKRTPPYLVPKEVDYTCTRDAGAKCQICPMDGWGGSAMRTINGHDPIILEIMRSTKGQVHDLLRQHINAQKCNKLTITPREMRTVETLHVRSSIDTSNRSTGGGDHTTREIISVGSHDAEANRTVEAVGTIYPDPRTQHNTFQAWEVTKTTTAIDKFDLDEETVNLMRVFQPGLGEDCLDRMAEISEQLAEHVTNIYGRRRMHTVMDLFWHSVISFDFMGIRQPRGWLDVLIVGDTRTGKSEAADKLREWYNAGEMISCESASFAGIVGGLQQFANKEWEITWGVIPLNDRRAVILDEISGLTTHQIAQMSSIRSSGEAQLTKIRDDRTWARTRLLWMGNPRNAGMDSFTYGVQAVQPLIGNKEDVARFDLVLTVRTDDVDAREINKNHEIYRNLEFSKEACQALIRWVWSRKPEQVLWQPGAEEMVYRVSLNLGEQYIEDPPLIQRANVRFKIARLAVAIAARTFSTDETFENIVVGKEHVRAARKVLTGIYNDPSFGYLDLSVDRKDVVKDAVDHDEQAKEWMYSHENLVKFLRSMGEVGHFRRQDIEDMLGVDKDFATTIVNKMFTFGLVRRDKANIAMEPILHQMLREIKLPKKGGKK